LDNYQTITNPEINKSVAHFDLAMAPSDAQRTLGQHLGTRLSQIGVKRFFGVPGDYNLSLLDELCKEEDLEPCWACSELNAGYAADGYARAAASGVGCLVVTFTVGGLSAINAVAGAYAENLPLICIVGGPNSNDFASGRIIHHTVGKRVSFLQELQCFKEVTCEQVVIHTLDSAHELIDKALAAALEKSKPVYILLSCNLASMSHPSFARPPTPYSLSHKASNPESLEVAVRSAAEFLNAKQKPVLVAGPLLRMTKAVDAFMQLVDAMGCAFAFMPAAKGLVPEDHPQCLGTYWGQVSSPGCGEVVESADAYLFAGAIMNDYATVGYTLNLSDAKMVKCCEDRVSIAGGKDGLVFGCVRMPDFLSALAQQVKRNHTSLDIYRRLEDPAALEPFPLSSSDAPGALSAEPAAPLLTRVLFAHIQRALTPDTILMAETGDSIFNCQKLRLPRGCTYEWSQQYGSIGWSVGACLGAAVAGAERGRRVLACIGDGSFQVTAVDVSTMLRYKLNPVIVLINNGSYTIEVQIHDGPYNELKVWNYVGFIEALDNGAGAAFTARVKTEEELVAALDQAYGEHKDKLCFLEVIVHRDDCSRELLEWGSLVSKANSRPPAQG